MPRSRPVFKKVSGSVLNMHQRQPPPSIWDAGARWIGTMLPRPALAVAYVTLLLVIGGTAGWTHAHQTNARVNNELGRALRSRA